MTFKRFILLTSLLVLVPLTSMAEASNPFTPIFSTASEGGAEVYVDDGSGTEKHPMQRLAVKNYVLMAVIVSADNSLALVRAGNGGLYYLRINDLLGNAEGVVTDINGSGIEVTEKDNVVSLLVRNRSAGDAKTQ